VPRIKAAIIGTGNIGTDLMIKILRLSTQLQLAALVGIDPDSEGLRRAARLGASTTAQGIEGLVRMPEFAEIGIVFDATSAAAHAHHNEVLQRHGKIVIDLTPAAIGPYTVPCVNGEANLEARNMSLITCGGQATIPIVAAVHRVAQVHYAEIVASIASKSAGPGTRANIDEFTETTARALVQVGGAARGKAIIVLNPAEPPLVMRDTVYCLIEATDARVLNDSIENMVAQVRRYVPGYRLKQAVQFEPVDESNRLAIPGVPAGFTGLKVSVFLEVEGAAHYLPAYAGNLDIMTSAALQMAEKIAARICARAAA
jgi:acetaldehyde dehydrogenase